MTIDRNTIVTLHKKGHSNSSIARSSLFAVVKKFNYTENICNRPGQGRKQKSELRLKGELATRIELDFPRKAPCRMRSFRGWIEGCC